MSGMTIFGWYGEDINYGIKSKVLLIPFVTPYLSAWYLSCNLDHNAARFIFGFLRIFSSRITKKHKMIL